jgi:hypothetical protein
MQRQVHEHDHDQRGQQGVDKAPRERIAQALTDDEADVEQAMTQDGVGKRRRHGEEHERQRRQRASREDVGFGLEPVTDDDTYAGCGADDGADFQNLNATPIGQRRRSPAVRDQQSDRRRAIGSVDGGQRRAQLRQAGGGPGGLLYVVADVNMPRHRNHRGHQARCECGHGPPWSREYREEGEDQWSHRRTRGKRNPEKQGGGLRQGVPEIRHTHRENDRHGGNRREQQRAEEC